VKKRVHGREAPREISTVSAGLGGDGGSSMENGFRAVGMNRGRCGGG